MFSRTNLGGIDDDLGNKELRSAYVQLLGVQQEDQRGRFNIPNSHRMGHRNRNRDNFTESTIIRLQIRDNSDNFSEKYTNRDNNNFVHAIKTSETVTELKASKVLRGGATAKYVNLETTTCSYRVDVRDKSVAFAFDLKSKGGGTTNVVFRLGKDDLPDLLVQLGKSFPELAPSFASAAASAYEQNLKDLEKARKVSQSTKILAESLVAELEPVAEYVYELYMNLPPGQDEREENLNDKMNNVIGQLQGLN